MRDSVVAFAGDSTARQQAVSLRACCTLPPRSALLSESPSPSASRLEPSAAASTELLTPCWCGTIASTGPTRWTTGGPAIHQRCTQRSLASFCRHLRCWWSTWENGSSKTAAKTCTLHDTPRRFDAGADGWPGGTGSCRAIRKLGLPSEALETAIQLLAASELVVVLRTGTPATM